MFIAYYGIIIGLALVFCSFAYLARKKLQSNDGIFLKISSLVLAGVFVIRYLWNRDAIENIIFSSVESPIASTFVTALTALLIWFSFVGLIALFLYPFFKQKWLKNLVRFCALPVFIIIALCVQPVFTIIQGWDAFTHFDARLIIYCVEIALAITLALYVFLTQGKFKASKHDWKILAIIIIPLLIATIPNYMPQLLFGYGGAYEKAKGFTVVHRLLLYVAVIVPFVLYFSLKKLDKKVIRAILLFISLGTLITYCRIFSFETFLHPNQWPLHLCNTAMFLVPICLIFRCKRLFYFTLFVNVFGAFTAMLMPNYTITYTLSSKLINFWINHYIAFFMPIVMLSLGMYERPKIKQFIHAMMWFAIYFAFVLVLNAWFSNFGSCDFFFINSDFIADKLGNWAENLRNVQIDFSIAGLNFVFYPIYQILFFIVYCLLSLGVWFVYEQFYTIAESHSDLKKRKLAYSKEQMELYKELKGRSIEEPMEIELQNQLVLTNLTKRYGTSDVYAVKDANLTVNSGEVFGFLGPNGAGKSTIIKSIVGIQPFTSGSINVCGFDVVKQSVMAKKQIGFVPDHYELYEKLTGREYVNYIADLYDVSQNERDERIEKYIDLFELKGAFDNQIKTYSHGMKQKITIISALVHKPKVWILDEPLTGLDPNSIHQVKECMKLHASEGNIVFFSSHIIDIVERICDRIAIIKKGTILCTVQLDELEKQGIVLEDYYLEKINGIKSEQ